jgi:chitinase
MATRLVPEFVVAKFREDVIDALHARGRAATVQAGRGGVAVNLLGEWDDELRAEVRRIAEEYGIDVELRYRPAGPDPAEPAGP